jgi:hypothetical protein
MNAATSRHGVLCDIPITFVAVAVVGTATVAITRVVPSIPIWAACVLVIPILVSVAVSFALRSARDGVVLWLASLPFPIRNVNAVLSGSGEYFEVHFKGLPPERAVVMGYLARATDETFVMESDTERKIVTARFGVMSSKLNPYGEANARFSRLRIVADRALTPLHAQHAIDHVLIV